MSILGLKDRSTRNVPAVALMVTVSLAFSTSFRVSNPTSVEDHADTSQEPAGKLISAISQVPWKELVTRPNFSFRFRNQVRHVKQER